MARSALLVLLALAATLAVAPTEAAEACVCVNLPLEERLDESDAAVVGRIVDERVEDAGGIAQRILTVEVDQRVKGDVESPLSVVSPSGTTCDVTAPPAEEAVGLLLARAPNGSWNASLCSVVDPGELVVVGGEPRGGTIKVAVGLVILALVLLWAFVRLRRGARPELPGPPGDRTPEA